jgi:hypothetical protein
MTALTTTLREKTEVRGDDGERHDELCLSTAELAECTCPDFCERDHETD